jgi:glycosyltransferase involved in cell wall biosynthesis
VDFAESLRHSRCLILPSRQDNWGVVVHEAACAGCALVTSNKAGVADDLVTKKNGHVFDSGRVASLTSALKLLQSWNADAWNQAGQESLRLAGQFGPKKWQAVFADLCREAGVAVVASDHR